MTSERSIYNFCKYWCVPEMIVLGPNYFKGLPDDFRIIKERGYDMDHILYKQIMFRQKYPHMRQFDILMKQCIPFEPSKTTGFSDSEDLYSEEAIERTYYKFLPNIACLLKAGGFIE